MNVIPFIAALTASNLMIAGAVFVAIVAGMWFISELFFNGSTRSENRLEELRRAKAGKNPRASATDGIKSLLTKASPKISDAIKPKNEKEVNKMLDKLSSAGIRNDQAIPLFQTIKVVMGVGGLFLGGFGGLLKYGFDVKVFIASAAVGFVFFILPEIILGMMAKKRMEKVFLGLPDALDLMVVCVEAGLGLDQAMRRVAEEMQKSHKVIADEFELCNTQLQMGSTRELVLTDLGARNGVEDLRNLASVMIQVDKFGTSVGKALRTQSDAMRVRRRQIAEEKAAKTAVKMIFPLVLFIFPGIFVVLVGPAAVRVMNDFLTT